MCNPKYVSNINSLFTLKACQIQLYRRGFSNAQRKVNKEKWLSSDNIIQDTPDLHSYTIVATEMNKKVPKSRVSKFNLEATWTLWFFKNTNIKLDTIF